MTTSPNLENPLWKFSLAVYAAQEVADECLALQERLQLDVNLLLFAAHAGAAEGVQLALRDVAAAADVVATWHEDIVRALRRARQALKPFGSGREHALHAASSKLRAAVKAEELEAEKIEQAMLWDWSRSYLAGRQARDRRQAMEDNLRVLLAFYGVPGDQTDPMAAVPHLAHAAMAYVGSPTARSAAT